MNKNIDKQAVVLNRFEQLTVGGTVPVERCGQRIFADENYVYMIGGNALFPERTLSDALRFNRLTKQWQQCTPADPNHPLPAALASFSLVSRGPPPDCNTGSNEAYIFGGIEVPLGGPSNSNSSFYWLKIDKQGRVHVQRQSMRGPEPLPPMFGQGMCRRVEKTAGGKGPPLETIYILEKLDVWRLQRAMNAAQTDSWELARLKRIDGNPANVGIGRYRVEMVPWKNRLFIFGGATIIDEFFPIANQVPIGFEELTVFNLDTNEFEQLVPNTSENTFPPERSCHAIIQRDNHVYLIGGSDEHMNGLTDVWRFNLDTLEWSELNTQLPEPVFFHSAAITPDACIFVFGGVYHNPLQTLCVNHLQRMWLEPPSLKYSASNQFLRTLTDQQREEYTRQGIRLDDVAVRAFCPNEWE